MKLDLDRKDIFRIVGLGYKKKTPEDLKYARFNRRMIAVTLDSLVLLFLSPFLDQAFDYLYGPIIFDPVAFDQQLSAQVDEAAAAHLYWTTIYKEGLLARWFYNLMFQFGVLGFLTGLCWWKWSSTPGKMIMRIKIVDATTEQPMTLLQVLARILGYYVSGFCLGLGFLWMNFNKRRQGWHDIIAHTAVIVVPWGPFNPGGKKQDAKPATPAADQ
jgi:uncharacterized RDD family membrane protein YckC